MDFELAGVARAAAASCRVRADRAFALLPRRHARRRDIKAINWTDVELDTDEGPLRLLVPGLPHWATSTAAARRREL
jgi:hypothetical protein